MSDAHKQPGISAQHEMATVGRAGATRGKSLPPTAGEGNDRRIKLHQDGRSGRPRELRARNCLAPCCPVRTPWKVPRPCSRGARCRPGGSCNWSHRPCAKQIPSALRRTSVWTGHSWRQRSTILRSESRATGTGILPLILFVPSTRVSPTSFLVWLTTCVSWGSTWIISASFSRSR